MASSERVQDSLFICLEVGSVLTIRSYKYSLLALVSL